MLGARCIEVGLSTKRTGDNSRTSTEVQTMSQDILLSVAQSRTSTGTRRTVTLTGAADASRPNLQIFYDLIDDTTAPAPHLLDGFVCAVIFYAMRLRQPIRVRGAVSRDCLRNLNEFQEAWASWKPELYTKIEVIPDETIECVETKQDAIAAFSGGVDSIFTILRHANGGNSTYPLKKSVLMVHGFDVPLSKVSQLNALQERTLPLIKELGLETRTIITNSKVLNFQDWEDSTASQLAACLHNYSHEFGFGLIGSSEPYNQLVLPWGSNPATDHLLSGGALNIVHDGAGYSRTQKVEQLAKFTTAIKIAKVCWEGTDASKNCGRCEKCIRTMLNFKAVGVSNPSCFEEPLDTTQIRSINIHNDIQRAELRSIVTYADAKGLNADWLDELKKRIGREQRYSPLLDKAITLGYMARNGQWQEVRRRIVTRLTALYNSKIGRKSHF